MIFTTLHKFLLNTARILVKIFATAEVKAVNEDVIFEDIN